MNIASCPNYCHQNGSRLYIRWKWCFSREFVGAEQCWWNPVGSINCFDCLSFEVLFMNHSSLKKKWCGWPRPCQNLNKTIVDGHALWQGKTDDTRSVTPARVRKDAQFALITSTKQRETPQWWIAEHILQLFSSDRKLKRSLGLQTSCHQRSKEVICETCWAERHQCFRRSRWFGFTSLLLSFMHLFWILQRWAWAFSRLTIFSVIDWSSSVSWLKLAAWTKTSKPSGFLSVW